MRSRRTMALLGLCALAGLGVVVATVGVGGGGGSQPLPTTGDYAPITVAKSSRLALVGGVLLGDADSLAVEDVEMTLKHLPGPHRYQLTLLNTSGIGYINAFQWFPPAGVGVVKVIGSSSGHCKLSGTTGFGGNQFKALVLDPNILCDGVNLKPPTCTCKGDGGFEEITFVATKDLGLAGVARMISMTPVLKIIPSYAKP